jgi:outer membrane translocation and assembly module TamA
MKKIIALIVFFAFVTTNAQDLTIIHINAKWNQKNNYKYIDDLNGVKVEYGYLEDQAPSIKQNIKAVPTIILMKNGRPVYVWSADISLKLKLDPDVIQNVINQHRGLYRRQSTD